MDEYYDHGHITLLKIDVSTCSKIQSSNMTFFELTALIFSCHRKPPLICLSETCAVVTIKSWV